MTIAWLKRYPFPAILLAIVLADLGMLGLGWLRRTPYDRLMDAIDRRDAAAVRRELKGGLDPNRLPPEYDEPILPLCAAAMEGDLEIANLLLDHGARIEEYDGWTTPLQAAAEHQQVAMMKLLIARGAAVNDYGPGGSHALWRAAVDGEVESVRCLLAHGANPNTTANGEKLIDVVRLFHRDEVAKVLESAGAR